jgi:tartrate dehydrogenase/decarboxylase/D-malate dehydrogenase
VFWDEVAEIVRKDFPTVEYRRFHVDAIAARMVTHPATLDVIVCSNLFGDILTDIGSAISGSLGIAPGANINPERTYPSMFEPIHGSAPDIAGKGIANPIGAIWAGAQMLDHLGHRDLHDKVMGAIERVVSSGKNRTPDLGSEDQGSRRCDSVGDLRQARNHEITKPADLESAFRVFVFPCLLVSGPPTSGGRAAGPVRNRPENRARPRECDSRCSGCCRTR